MPKPIRYTAAAIQRGDVDLIAREARQANRIAGANTWYREVLIARVGTRHVATGRAVLADGMTSDERVQFAVGTEHQTYEVRDVADLDGPLTRSAVHDMRAAASQIIDRHTRLDVTAEQVRVMFYAELVDLLAMLRADAEVEAHDMHTPTPAAAPVELPLSWRTVRAGHYAAGVDGEFEVRRDAQASADNRWVLRLDGKRVSAHRLLKTAQAAGESKRTARAATAAAATAVADQPTAPPALNTVVTITPLGGRQFVVVQLDDLDDMVRVAPRRVRCEHDLPKWVGRAHVRPVPAALIEDVPAEIDDDPEYDATCAGHPPRPPVEDTCATCARPDGHPTSEVDGIGHASVRYPAGTPEYDRYVAELRPELAKFAAFESPYELLAQCHHGVWVALRALPRGWWHIGSDTWCDGKTPHVPTNVDRPAVYAQAKSGQPAAPRDTEPDRDSFEISRPGGGVILLRPDDLVTIDAPDGPAWQVHRLIVRGGVTPAPYALLRDPHDPTIVCGSYVGDLLPLPAERVAAVEAGHDISIVAARKLDAGTLVQAVCSCGAYVSAPGTPVAVRNSGAAHQAAKMGATATGVRNVAEALLALAASPDMHQRVTPAGLRALAATLLGRPPADDPHGAPAGAGERARTAAEVLPTVGQWPGKRDPYVGEGADGARRSAEIDRAEADTYDTGSERWRACRASAERWDEQAAYLEKQADSGTQLT